MILLALGAYQAYQHFEGPSTPAGCEGWEEWGRSSEARFNALMASAEGPQSQGSAQAEALDIANDLREAASEQRLSNPPDNARELNDAYASFYAMFARQLEAFASGGPLPYTDAQLTVQAERMESLMADANRACGG